MWGCVKVLTGFVTQFLTDLVILTDPVSWQQTLYSDVQVNKCEFMFVSSIYIEIKYGRCVKIWIVLYLFHLFSKRYTPCKNVLDGTVEILTNLNGCVGLQHMVDVGPHNIAGDGPHGWCCLIKIHANACCYKYTIKVINNFCYCTYRWWCSDISEIILNWTYNPALNSSGYCTIKKGCGIHCVWDRIKQKSFTSSVNIIFTDRYIGYVFDLARYWLCMVKYFLTRWLQSFGAGLRGTNQHNNCVKQYFII